MISLNNNNSSEPVYTLAVASKLSLTPAHSIRQYIDKGLFRLTAPETGNLCCCQNFPSLLEWDHDLNENSINNLQFADLQSSYHLNL